MDSALAGIARGLDPIFPLTVSICSYIKEQMLTSGMS